MSDDELVPAPHGENPFHLEPDQPGFESLGQDNGFRFWWASQLGDLLGYASLTSFFKAVQKAMSVCITLGIDLSENIVPHRRDGIAKEHTDYKLSRFACYLVAMNGDSAKPEVACAQAYFAAIASSLEAYMHQAEGVERVQIRGEVSERERTLSGATKAAGVTNFAFFQNAGYRGLYNMDLWKLRQIKSVANNRSPLDFMGKEELAANLFRITQTEAKIRNEAIRGQRPLEKAAESVGRKVRAAIHDIGGTMPENLPPAGDIKTVQKTLKSTHREFKKLDDKKRNTPKV